MLSRTCKAQELHGRKNGQYGKTEKIEKSDSIFLEKVCLWLYLGCDCAVSHISREITLEVKRNISGKHNGVWKSYNSESVGYFFTGELDTNLRSPS